MLLWLRFNQADLCPYTPLRISKPNEFTIGRYRYIFDSVPPQPNCPPIGVPLSRLVTQSQISGVTLSPTPHADAHGLKQLPLTLYIKNRITTTGYSKVSRGLRFPLEIPGLYTRKECSGDPSSGQWRSRYTIHASRHSNGKVLRYLKRVIVTPAVYQLFTPLKRSLKYWHWAGIAFYTQPYDLAEG